MKTKHRSLNLIAIDIRRDWANINYAARPYVDAMYELDQVDDMYYDDPAWHIVNYFLGNAQTWRGFVAREIKAELKQIIKDYMAWRS